jgi:hypothetical protein
VLQPGPAYTGEVGVEGIGAGRATAGAMDLALEILFRLIIPDGV